MKYKITTLFDSPDMKIGTIIYAKEIYRKGKVEYLECCVEGQNYVWRSAVNKFDNPKWYKKELDDNYISNISCPKCGSTNGILFSDSYYDSDIDSNSHGCQYSVGIECVCGHKRIIYGTIHGNRFLRARYGVEDK